MAVAGDPMYKNEALVGFLGEVWWHGVQPPSESAHSAEAGAAGLAVVPEGPPIVEKCTEELIMCILGDRADPKGSSGSERLNSS